MNWLEAFFCALGLIVFLGVVLIGLTVAFVPSVSREIERQKVEREAQEASFRIHQQATRAFGQMLEAARQAERREEGL